MIEIPFAVRFGVHTRLIWRCSAGVCALLVAATCQWLNTRDSQRAMPQASVTASDAHATVIAPEPPAERDYQQITQWHLFGKPPAIDLPVSIEVPRRDELPAPVPVGKLPTSGAKLALSGVLYSENDDVALAIVTHAPHTEKIYAVGDTLPGNVELADIERKRIVVRRDGRYEEVLLPRLGDEHGGASLQNSAGRQVESTPRAPTRRPNVSGAPAP